MTGYSTGLAIKRAPSRLACILLAESQHGGIHMEIKHDPINNLLRNGKTNEVNAMIASGAKTPFSGADFRGLDLTGLNTKGSDFSGSSFRLADLRGLDLSSCNLKGASLRGANISGTLFPAIISAQEIMMSVEYGTRLRY
ncbi:MAG: pentapeptide repeat-containing protein [Mariprofundus sp.]|nr:pentapeptide repeat-containing protein [Mariprofundus sp.]